MSKRATLKAGSPKQIKKKTDHEFKVGVTEMHLTCRDHAAITIATLDRSLDVCTAMDKLHESIARLLDGKTTEIEAMLITQAKTLEYVFYDALRKLADSKMEYAEVYTNIAFRAQNQSRKALMALAELKNPRRSVFVKQQNNAINQQVNNVGKQELSDFKNSQKVTNELLEVKENEQQWMDTRAQETAGTTHSPMETLESINRSKNNKRKIDE